MNTEHHPTPSTRSDHGQQFSSPGDAPVFSSAEVADIYRRRFNAQQQAAKDRLWQAIVEGFLQRWVRSEDTVLDLGCGYGEFLNHVRCQRRIGVDLNPDSSSRLQAGIEFHLHSVCQLPFLADNSVDVVFSSNLLEHLPGKRAVEQLVCEARRVLRPGGHLVLLGPNLRFLPGAYWDFWDHLTPITDRSLVELLKHVGYVISDAHPRFLPYTTLSKLPSFPLLVRLYLKLPLAWRILGKQFLIRAQKPVVSMDEAAP